MTSLLAGTVAHGARGGRGVSTTHYRRRVSPGLSGTLRHSPELPGNGSHNNNDALFIFVEMLPVLTWGWSKLSVAMAHGLLPLLNVN